VLAADRPHPGCALQDLLEEEHRSHLCTAVRQQAMLAIAALRYQPSPCFAWHLSTASSPGPGGASPVWAEPDGTDCRASALPCLGLVQRAGGIRTVLWPRAVSGREGCLQAGLPHHSLRPSQGPLPQRCLGAPLPAPVPDRPLSLFAAPCRWCWRAKRSTS